MAVFGPHAIHPHQLQALHSTPSHWRRMNLWKRWNILQGGPSKVFVSTPQRGRLASSGIASYSVPKRLWRVSCTLLARGNTSRHATVTKCPSSHPDFQYADRKQTGTVDFFYIKRSDIVLSLMWKAGLPEFKKKRSLPILENKAFLWIAWS